VCKPWKFISSHQYHSHGFHSNMYTDFINTGIIFSNIRKYLINAVHKRCSTTDRPIACLLSGGLDSSLITAIVNNYHIQNGLPTLETYSIGIEGSDDLKHAQIVANFLGTKHTEIVLTEHDFINAIPEVIKGIESYDTTTVRASIGNWLLGKYISKHSDAKVIFNGDGSDELTGGYLYMGCAPDEFEFDKECRRLLKDIHTFDVLRSDKSISSHGLEPRTPFLDREWVEFYLSIPTHIRFHTNDKLPEKYLIRKAFSKEEYVKYDKNPILPDSVLWRRKEAFSDGVSTQNRALYQIIQEHMVKTVNLYSDSSLQTHLPPQTHEQIYYRTIFEEHYAGLGHIIPYFWMPKYVKATDSSARTLSIYK
ncbi:MAG: asparagine synthase-related protein, partial [Minisyncoccia bacterium]